MADEQQGRHTDVRKCFFYIKENVSSDWKDLAFHLEFRRSDINNIEGRNRDDKSRCMDLLEEWLKRNGEKATTEALMGALSEANLQSTVDGIKTKYPDMQTPQALCSKRKREREDHDQYPVKKQAHCKEMRMEEFQKAVKRYYELKLTYIKPLIWNGNFTLTLSDIFTELELITMQEKQRVTHERHRESGRRKKLSLVDDHFNPDVAEFLWSSAVEGEQRKPLHSLDDLFNPDVTGRSTAPRCILIEGEAGGGKTTFLSKVAIDAVSQRTELGRRHDIVLLIRLREVRDGDTIEEMVMDQCVPEIKGFDVECIGEILQVKGFRVLFLLDGYDELRPEARAAGQAIPKLLSGKIFPYSTIVITSRPSAGLQQYTSPDCDIHIVGFSREHVNKYVRQYFNLVEKPELADDFMKQFGIDEEAEEEDNCNDDDANDEDFEDTYDDDDDEKDQPDDEDDDNELLNSLLQTPMFLMLVCVLWDEDKEMVSTGTMTGLYTNLLTCLVRKYCRREGVDMPLDGLPAEVDEALLQLGKLALETLMRNDTLLDLAQLERENVDWELLLKLGLVSLEFSASKLHPRKQLNFSHKTMQEFLAGRYVAHAAANQDIVELLQLTSITKALELGNLLQFTCGCNSRAAQAVMKAFSCYFAKEFGNLRAEQCEPSHVPIGRKERITLEMYHDFVALCFEILSERQELEVLQALRKALPIVIFDSLVEGRQATALKYYIKCLQPANLPDRLILNIRSRRMDGDADSRDVVEYLQHCFSASLPSLKVDLDLSAKFDSPDHVDRLVSVLKNVSSLRALDLSNTGLTPSSLQPLVRGFSHVSVLEALDLSDNRGLGDAGMAILQAGLSSVPHLAVLRIVRVRMTAVGMSSLTHYLRHLAELIELDISYNEIGDTGLESLTTALPTFTAMQVFVMRRTGISPTCMRTLVPVLHQLTGLIKVDISGNYIGDSGLECLADILPRLTATKVLDLSSTDISDRGISALVKALPHLVELQVLDVSDNYISDSGIVSLFQTLSQPSCLDAEQSPPGDKSLTIVPHNNATLQELYVGKNSGVTGAGLGMVAQLISALPALTGLNMSCFGHTPANLSDTAAMALAEALPRLPFLEWLDVRFISMEPAGFRAVVQAAEAQPTLQELWYSEKGVPPGADTSASCLRLSGRWVYTLGPTD